jgi:hypothetical protein
MILSDLKTTMTEPKQTNLHILGIGGHGWSSIKHVIDSFEGDVVISMLPVDWGGSTGTIGRLMKINDGLLNKSLHGDKKYPIYPFGDLNKFISIYLEHSCKSSIKVVSGEKLVNCLEFRSDSHRVLMRVFIKLIGCLKIEEETIRYFDTYLKKYLEYCLEYKDSLDNPKTTSLGNIWHSFLFYQFKGMDGLVGFYKSKNIIPLNFTISFTSEDREDLNGAYLDESNQIIELKGEDAIDISHYPIDPSTFGIETKYSNQKIVTSKFLRLLESADTIIIPNGSLANWLPYFNIKEVLKILYNKCSQNKLIWIMNLFHSKNEYPFDVYYHYLSILNITPIVLGPESIPVDYYVSFLKEYQKEGKTLNYNFNTQPHQKRKLEKGFNNCLEVVSHLDDKTIEGLKYKKDCLKEVILAHLNDKIIKR